MTNKNTPRRRRHRPTTSNSHDQLITPKVRCKLINVWPSRSSHYIFFRDSTIIKTNFSATLRVLLSIFFAFVSYYTTSTATLAFVLFATETESPRVGQWRRRAAWFIAIHIDELRKLISVNQIPRPPLTTQKFIALAWDCVKAALIELLQELSFIKFLQSFFQISKIWIIHIEPLKCNHVSQQWIQTENSTAN